SGVRGRLPRAHPTSLDTPTTFLYCWFCQHWLRQRLAAITPGDRRDRPLPHRRPPDRPRRPSRPAGPHPLAQRGRRRRPRLRLSAATAARARRVLAHRLRLARARDPAERTAPFPHRDRRTARAFRARPVGEAGRARPDPHPWLARLVPRVPRRDRAAVTRFPPGDPLHPRLRVLRADPRTRLGHPPHRPRLGRTDAPPRLRALRRAGRRL